MIERYTIKFAPAVSQKELEKALNESGETHPHINKLKARVEFVGEFDDIRKVKETLKELSKQ